MGAPEKIGQIIRESIESIDYREPIKIGSIDYSSIDREYIENDKSAPSQSRERVIADKLLKILGEPSSWKFYLKCAYRLSEDQIWTFAELAMSPKVVKHNNYFVRLASAEMSK